MAQQGLYNGHAGDAPLYHMARQNGMEQFELAQHASKEKRRRNKKPKKGWYVTCSELYIPGFWVNLCVDILKKSSE